MDAALAGLLHGCAGEPDDPTQRLILADWLEDHGQPDRAAFVRHQLRLAGWVPDWKLRQKLLAEDARLVAENSAAWLGDLPSFCEHVEFGGGLARIWVTSRSLTSAGFRKELEKRLDTALIESLRITHAVKLKRIAGLAFLESFPALSLARLDLSDEALGDFLASPYLDHVAALDLSNNKLTDAGATTLIESAAFQRLVRLEVRNNDLTAAGVQSLLARAGATLRDIDPDGNTLDRASYERLTEWRAARGTRVPRVVNSLGMEFVTVPAGSFRMGSTREEAEDADRTNEHYKHTVTLTRPYYLDRFAITQRVYEAVMGENPAAHKSPCHPVVNVTYAQVQEFCTRLSALPAEKAAKRTYRLPTEAEWEHACRAGTFTQYSYGHAPSTDFINYDGRYPITGGPDGAYLRRTAPVGSYPPNAFGLYEMHGNVWEWTSDCYQETYPRKEATDPTGPNGDVEGAHPIRGGCWEAVGNYCRSAHRYGEDYDNSDAYTGFRVVLMTAG